MSTTTLRVTPVGGFDIPALEDWLAAMAGKGLRFTDTIGPFTLFEKTAEQTVQIHLEPIQGAVRDDPGLNALYGEAGWQYWGRFRGSFYVFACGDLTARAHTEPEVQDYALKRFFRERAVAGALLVLANVLLLSPYRNGAPWEVDLTWLKHYPVEAFSTRPILPFWLSVLGLLLLDLSYLLGLSRLRGYRKAVREGRPQPGRGRFGWMQAVGLALLLPVALNTAQLFLGLDYRPYDLEGSGFVTLTHIEGEDFPLSRNHFYSMDYISHSGTLLDPETWYFRQYGTSLDGEDPGDVPNLSLTIVRYPLAMLAQQRAEEWSRQRFNGSGDYETLTAAYGLDEVRYAVRQPRTTSNGRVLQGGGIFVLRRGNTVLFADYYGEQDLFPHLEAFAGLLETL